VPDSRLSGVAAVPVRSIVTTLPTLMFTQLGLRCLLGWHAESRFIRGWIIG
jgi:hypothetical protein